MLHFGASASYNLALFRLVPGQRTMQRQNTETLQKLLGELDEALVREHEFITRGEELLFKCRFVAQAVSQRVLKVLQIDRQADSGSRS